MLGAGLGMHTPDFDSSITRLKHLEEVARFAPDYIIRCGPDGLIQYMNRPAPGHELSQMLGTSVERWMEAPYREEFRKCLGHVFERASEASYESVGSVSGRYYVNRVSPVVEDGRVVAAILVTHDITERRRLEEQARHAQRAETLGVMAAGIAHDFNNLLQVIRSEADHLAKSSRDPAAAEAGARIGRATERAADLTGQLLAYVGGLPARMAPVDLGALVRDSSRLLELSAGGNARLELDTAAPGTAVEADAVQLRQVVLNLVANAAESLGPAGGSIRVGVFRQALDRGMLDRALHDFSVGPGEYVTLEVRDDGAGIDAAIAPRIFDPFFSTKSPGRGLGLSTVYGIVKGHRGALELRSDPGRGTRVSVHLPWTARTPAAAGAEQAVRLAVPRGRILVADDEEGIRRALEVILGDLGFRAVCAVSGPDAVAALAADPDAFVMALVDFTMPGSSAAATVEGLRRIQPGLPVVIMSGYAADFVESSLPGARFLAKPFDLDEIANLLGVQPGAI